MLERSYVIYGTAPWDAPWLTEQNLAYALAKRHPVLYVEPPLTPLTPLRYGVRPDTVTQARLLLRRRPRRDGDVSLFRPVVLPPRSHPAARALSAPWLRSQVARVTSELGFEAPIALAAHAAPGLLGAAREEACVYLVKDWIEDGGDLLGRDPADLAAERDAMLGAAEIVCAISSQLQRTLSERGIPARLLRHGFHGDLAAAYEQSACPSEYRTLARPLLGYAGRIDARLDFELLAGLARRFPDASLVLVGPVSPRLPASELAELRTPGNVHLLGPRDRDALPGYLAHLDCCLLPYREREWLRHGSPLKLWDYLYAGPPLVGSGCLALRDYPPPLVSFATSAEDFADQVAGALAEPDAGVAERRAFALANTWDVRARELDAMVQDVCSAGEGSAGRKFSETTALL